MHIHQSTSALLSVALFIRHFPHNVTVHNKIAHLSRKKEKENKLNTRFQTCWCKEDTWCIVNANEFPVNTMEKRPPRVMHPAVHSSQKKKQNKKQCEQGGETQSQVDTWDAFESEAGVKRKKRVWTTSGAVCVNFSVYWVCIVCVYMQLSGAGKAVRCQRPFFIPAGVITLSWQKDWSDNAITEDKSTSEEVLGE